MSICSQLISSYSSFSSSSQKSPEAKQNIQNELIWGLMYRNYKENEKKKPMKPMHSPIDIPFEICRAGMLLKKKSKPVFAQQEEEKQDNGKPGKIKQKSKKRKYTEKPSLLDRSVWSQSKYMDFLSIPNSKFEEPKTKKYKKRCEMEPCPPRFVQLAIPNKRRVFSNWKEFAHFLPPEILLRFEEILHTDQNLEPREARYYYKKLDRQRLKELRKKKKRKKQKELEKVKDSDLRKAHIDLLAKDIVDYIQDVPLFTLNYKQMLLSDGILERLQETNVMKKPSRKTKNHYKKTVIEVADKLAVWIDTLTRFVDVQAVESDEDIPPISVASLTEEGEESEGFSEYESSTEEDVRDDQLFDKEEEVVWGEEEEEEGSVYEHGAEMVQNVVEDLFNVEGGEGFDEMLSELDDDLLNKLINILSDCSDDFLESEVDPEKMPGIKYNDILNKLTEIKKCLEKRDGKPLLEQIMLDWALKNDPDKVDDALMKKIHEVACLMGDWSSSGQVEDLDTTLIAMDETLLPGGEEEDVSTEEIVGGETAGATDDHEFKDWVKAEMQGEGGSLSEGLDKIQSGQLGKSSSKDLIAGIEGSKPKVSLDTQLELELASTTEGEGEVTIGDETELDLVGEESLGITPTTESHVESFITEGEGEGEVALAEEEAPIEKEEVTGLDGRIIKGHKPPKVFEHSSDTVCCLSLKTWAVWLLEITHNAHNWTQWMSCVIQKVKEYASIVRGDVKLPNGETKILRKAEWREFIKETEENVIAWRQYSAHVKDLSQSIVDNFHGKKVNCCSKCLQDHLIKNVVVAHNTLQALTEAISCAAYWQRCLDTLVEKTCGLAKADKEDADDLEVSSEESDEDVELEEVEGEESGESEYEIEQIESNINNKAAK